MYDKACYIRPRYNGTRQCYRKQMYKNNGTWEIRDLQLQWGKMI